MQKRKEKKKEIIIRKTHKNRGRTETKRKR
jgi:hypothetical protein